MSSVEFVRWKAFIRRHPFSIDRADWHAAMIVAMVAAVNTKDGKYEPKSFMPQYGSSDDAPLDPIALEEQQLALVEALNAHFGGTDLRT